MDYDELDYEELEDTIDVLELQIEKIKELIY